MSTARGSRVALAVAAFAVFVAAGGVFAVAYIENRDNRRSRAADYSACGRVNVTRARVNANSAGIWLALQGAQQNRAAPPAAQKLYARIVAVQSWQELVPCDRAVDNPFAYFQPDLHGFTLRSALAWSDMQKIDRLIRKYGRTVRDKQEKAP